VNRLKYKAAFKINPREKYGALLRMWRGYRKVCMQRRHNPKGISRPVFLVGCHRSGTNMVVYRLNRSWEIELYNEHSAMAFDNCKFRPPEVIKGLIDRSLAPLVLFKPISDTHRTDFLLMEFPQSKTLFTYRHFDDSVRSLLRAFGEKMARHIERCVEDDFRYLYPYAPKSKTKNLIKALYHPGLNPESKVALYWVFHNRFYFDLDLDKNVNVKLVQYESLVQDPERYFKSICNFIGIGFVHRMVEGIYVPVKRKGLLRISPEIKSLCEDLWKRLCAQPQ
jgi:hypothetical protein